MTREESPKPYTVEEARGLARLEQGRPGSVRAVAKVGAIRLLATAQAAAEAGSLRAQLEEARKRVACLEAVHEPIQKNREALCDKVLEQRRLLDAAADHGLSLEAALTTAQGEVAVLREVLEDWWPPTNSEGCCLSCGAWTPARHPEAHLHDHGCPAYAEQTRRIDSRKAALASTRATADAHDERVRREALEEAAAKCRSMHPGSFGRYLLDGPTHPDEIARSIEALAHPTKEKP